jgi:hypothetical protein
MRKWGQNAKVLTALKTLAQMGIFKNSCETAAFPAGNSHFLPWRHGLRRQSGSGDGAFERK